MRDYYLPRGGAPAPPLSPGPPVTDARLAPHADHGSGMIYGLRTIVSPMGIWKWPGTGELRDGLIAGCLGRSSYAYYPRTSAPRWESLHRRHLAAGGQSSSQWLGTFPARSGSRGGAANALTRAVRVAGRGGQRPDPRGRGEGHHGPDLRGHRFRCSTRGSCRPQILWARR